MSVIVIGPNHLLRIHQQTIIIGRIRSRPQNLLKVVITTQNKNSALPVKRHLCPDVPDCINKEASASFGHTLTCSSKHTFEAGIGEERREREAHYWARTSCICLIYLLALY